MKNEVIKIVYVSKTPKLDKTKLGKLDLLGDESFRKFKLGGASSRLSGIELGELGDVSFGKL